MATLNLWLKKPRNQEKFKDWVRLNHELNTLNNPVDTKTALKNISQRIETKQKSSPKKLPVFLKYAAILIGFSIIGYGIFYKSSQTLEFSSTPQITLQLEDGSIQIVKENQNAIILDASGKKITEQSNHELIYNGDSTNVQTLQYNTLKVPNGKRFGLILSDGSKVTLNSGSELRYPVQFIDNETTRTVFLNGEAYFEVAKNATHPFIVNAKDMNVEVIGTHFNVTSYSDDHKTYTVLVEGKVAAHSKLLTDDSKIISPNEKVFFNANSLETESVNTQKYIAWVTGELIFIDDSFNVIKNKLERHYDVTINNSYPALNDIMITATFKDEKIEDVLKIFQSYKSFNYTINNNIISISKPK